MIFSKVKVDKILQAVENMYITKTYKRQCYKIF